RVLGAVMEGGHATQKIVIRVKALGGLTLRPLDLSLLELWGDCPNDTRSYLVLQTKYVVKTTLETISPEMSSGTPPAPRCRAVRDSTLVAWYPALYAPRTGGAYDGHHRTAGIAGRTRRRGGGVAARGEGAAGRADAAHRPLTGARRERRIVPFPSGARPEKRPSRLC